ncbi:hypothetical protein FIBSPDRAFT_1045984 [Athelia psychrophila]|uniref:DUF6533 domain-containing protein n=1 Tax=Athelia psychrophila TaxID=1759441 RepID=A0A166HBB9_9AGAM|nr:hypothetical protein FIBSPDRAFT_1045984 [Fibularhizoctonia sp. CBS 109695]
MASILSPAALESALNDATYTRYFSAAGLVVLLFDHLLTFTDEVALVWDSKPSFTKYLFLLNRYLVPSVLIVVAVEMNGYMGGYSFTDTTITKLMLCGFATSFCATFSSMVATLAILWEGIQYNALAGMCITTNATPVLIAVWASPMLFETLVMASTCYNLFDRPRIANQRLARAIHQDGISFFAVLTTLRALNLALATTRKADLSMLAVFFVWSTTTLVLNRSYLHVRRVKVVEAFVNGAPEPEDRAESPSSVTDSQLHTWALEDGIYDKMAATAPQIHPRAVSSDIELRKVSHWGAIFDDNGDPTR